MLGTEGKPPRLCALCTVGKLPPKSTGSANPFPCKSLIHTEDIHIGLAGGQCGCLRYQRHLEDNTWAAKLPLALLAEQCWAAWRSKPFPHPWTVTGVHWHEKGAAFHQTSPKGTGRCWSGCGALRPTASGHPGPSSFSDSPSSCTLSLTTD